LWHFPAFSGILRNFAEFVEFGEIFAEFGGIWRNLAEVCGSLWKFAEKLFF